jgi:hypothetical protein
MLHFLMKRRSGGQRKLRLYAVACCRRIEHLLELPAVTRPEDYRRAIDAAERYADGLATEAELNEAYAKADDNYFLLHQQADPFLRVALPDDGVAAGRVADEAVTLVGSSQAEKERMAQVQLVRDLFGLLPFRPVVLDRNWLTSPVSDLARAIYSDRQFDALPILGDALEDAGCTDDNILSHCRGPGSHVRGCWVIDLILGKD